MFIESIKNESSVANQVKKKISYLEFMLVSGCGYVIRADSAISSVIDDRLSVLSSLSFLSFTVCILNSLLVFSFIFNALLDRTDVTLQPRAYDETTYALLLCSALLFLAVQDLLFSEVSNRYV